MPDLTRIQLRRGSTSDWTTSNPTLAAGEVGVELTSTITRFKIGNGNDTWSSLPYFDNTSVLDNTFATDIAVASSLSRYVLSTTFSAVLGSYSTTTQVNALVSTTLADYSTTAQITTTFADYSTTAQITTTLADYALNASPIITGTMSTQNLIVSSTTSVQSVDAGEISALTYTADVAVTTDALDFATAAFKTISIDAATTFTASNYAAGRTISVLVTNGATQRALTFPTNWVFVGTKPANIAASKKAILTVTSFGATEAECIAAWAVQL